VKVEERLLPAKKTVALHLVSVVRCAHAGKSSLLYCVLEISSLRWYPLLEL